MDDSSKRLDLIRNNLRPPLETAFLPPRIPDFQAAERSLPLEIQLPGTEFLDAETGGQKSALETADVRRDGKSGDDTGEIPAETNSLESPTKCAVWEDWMVGMIGIELVTPLPVQAENLRLKRFRTMSLKLPTTDYF